VAQLFSLGGCTRFMKILPYILISSLLLGCSPSQSRLQKFAEDFVKERQAKCGDRADHASSIVVGTKEDDVLKYMGEPDSKSDSDTAKNWLYWISASVKDGQIYEECVILKIVGGSVVERRQDTGFRKDIAEVYKEKRK